MSKNVKRRKNLLFKYKNYTDDMIINLLKIEIPKYEILIKSEMKAIEILSQYNIIALYQVNITLNDVIQRIEEFKQEEISWITEHNYLFDLYDSNMEYKTISSDEEVSDVYNKYNNINHKLIYKKHL